MRISLYKFLNLFSPIYNWVYKDRLRVLAYHDIEDAEIFESQILWLKSKYNLINIPILYNHLIKNDPLPPRALLLTLDDGDKTVYTKALSVFQKHKIPSCLFIITDLIDSFKDFWWETIKKNEKIDGLSDSQILKIINHNKSIPNSQRLQNLKEYKSTVKQQLKIEEIHTLRDYGVFIANHSHTHPMFDMLEEQDIIKELEKSNDFFKNSEVGDYSVFAYPNGSYNETSEQLLEKFNIKMAFLFDHKINKKKIQPLRISRIRVDSTIPFPEFQTKVSGLHCLILNVKNRILNRVGNFKYLHKTKSQSPIREMKNVYDH